MNSLRRIIFATVLLMAVSVAAISQGTKPKQKEKAETKVAPLGKEVKSEKLARDSSMIRLNRLSDLNNEEDKTVLAAASDVEAMSADYLPLGWDIVNHSLGWTLHAGLRMLSAYLQ